MISLTDEIKTYVEEHIGEFHKQRVECLNKLELNNILKRKNPYLFKAKNLMTSEEIVRSITDAHISSNEETIFGDWLEGLAIFINEKVYGGRKSSSRGIDLEFDKDSIRYIVAIKSGPNWANSSQIASMKADFEKAKKILRTSNSKINCIAVNGCCYGKSNVFDKGSYFKYCGQSFWEFISGNDNLYLDIIEPLGYQSKKKNEEFNILYSQKINQFNKNFLSTYCDENGQIKWDEIVKLNSESVISKKAK